MERQRPEWTASYLEYKTLKDLIKLAAEEAKRVGAAAGSCPAGAARDNSSGGTWLQRCGEEGGHGTAKREPAELPLSDWQSAKHNLPHVL